MGGSEKIQGAEKIVGLQPPSPPILLHLCQTPCFLILVLKIRWTRI